MINPRVLKASYLENYLISITFSNCQIKYFNLKTYLHYPIYQPLQDQSFCAKLVVFNGTIKWDSSIDFDPDTLYLESKSTHEDIFIQS